MNLISRILVLNFISLSLLAQENGWKKHELKVTFGGSNNYSESILSSDLDIMNYFYEPDDLKWDYQVAKIGYRWNLDSIRIIEFNWICMDDFYFDNFDLTYYHLKNEKFGIGAGAFVNKIYLYEDRIVSRLTDLNPNFKAKSVSRLDELFDFGFYVTPKYTPLNTSKYSLDLYCDVGLSSFHLNDQQVQLKKEFANEVRQIEFESKTNYQFYVNPRFDLRLYPFNFKKFKMGFVFNSNYYLQSKKLVIKEKTRQWTYSNVSESKIYPPNHKYSRLEFDAGLSFRF